MLSESVKIASLEDEKQKLKEVLEEAQHRLEKVNKKNKQYKERLLEAEDRFKKVVDYNLKFEDKFQHIENEMRRKVNSVKEKLHFRLSKEQKIKTLGDTIKIAIQQSKLEMSSSRMSRNTILRARITKLANTFENIFGGIVFISALNVPENSALIVKKDPAKKFIGVIFSKGARAIAKQMGMDSSDIPMLERSPISQYVLDSREPYFPDLSLLRLPANHFPLSKALFVPIIVDGKPMGIAGFGNGNYDLQDAAIILETLTSAWISVISEAMKESQISQSLVSNTLPKHVIDRYMAYENELQTSASARGASDRTNPISGTQLIIADSYPVATIVFSDIVGFTRLSSSLAPEEVVSFLNRFFTIIDEIVELRGLEKIKTIGDCYMVACGIPNRNADHAEMAAEFALDVMEISKDFILGEAPLQLRIGIHSGPIVAGVIGKTKLTYDVWGDTVNKASRMESTGTPGSIQITEDTMKFLKGNDKYIIEPRGSVKVHGIGDMPTYFLKRNEAVAEKTGHVVVTTTQISNVALLPMNMPRRLETSDSVLSEEKVVPDSMVSPAKLPPLTKKG